MTTHGRRPVKCRCGRETWKPEYVRGILLCASCAFDAEYGIRGNVSQRPEARPEFRVRKVS